MVQHEPTTLSNSIQKAFSDAVQDVADFPRAGVLFKDLKGVWRDPRLCQKVVDAVARDIEAAGGADAVVGIESRGFLLGMPLAMALGVPFLPARKGGKLPGPVFRTTYGLEYGQDVLELQADGLGLLSRIWIHDDVLATGGTAEAAAKLVEMAGGRVAGFSFLLEIVPLKGRERLLDRGAVLPPMCSV